MISELANHLWQSTLFAVVVGLLTLMCRKNHASVRYWLWFSASVKFFIPFALLMTLGDRLEWPSRAPQIAAPAVSATLAQVSRPFVVEPMRVLPMQEAPRGVDWFTLALFGVWVAGTIAMTAVRFRTWRQIRAAIRTSSPWAVASQLMPAGVAVRSTPGVMEPGVVGVWRPVILVPSGLEDDLTPRQLATVLTHELCHVRRRDNMTAAVHMITEAVFWFHPLVWWIGSRLLDERERACDEEVVRTFGEPRTYAEGIVNVCRRYVESPLACVSGVSGSNVKNRIRDIMTNRAVAKLSVAKKALLAGVGATVLVAPILAQSVPLPSFEVASVKPTAGGQVRIGDKMWTTAGAKFLPNGAFDAVNATLGSIIRLAYGLREFQTVGGPEWIDTERFDIQARAPQGAMESDAPRRLQSLLAERFALKVRSEKRDRPIYALVLARADGSLGPRLRQSQTPSAGGLGNNQCAPPGPPGPFNMRLCGVTIAQLVERYLPMYSDRLVVDRTGLSGGFDFVLHFDNRPIPGVGPFGGLPPTPQAAEPAASDAVSIFTALEEQLGLKLEPQTAPVEVLVIDHVERPTAN
jgi:bla regulator protein blaR1